MESGLLSSESEIQDSGLSSARVAKYHYVVSPTDPYLFSEDLSLQPQSMSCGQLGARKGRASMTVMLPRAAPENTENSGGRE